MTEEFAHKLKYYEQNPFYLYLAQAIGIDLAKLLNLNQISMLWAGRLFNLLLYASFTFIAIKKTPILKVPMAVVATFPLAIVQAASFSSDSFIFSFSFIVIAYLLYMYKAKEGSLTKKEIGGEFYEEDKCEKSARIIGMLCNAARHTRESCNDSKSGGDSTGRWPSLGKRL